MGVFLRFELLKKLYFVGRMECKTFKIRFLKIQYFLTKKKTFLKVLGILIENILSQTHFLQSKELCVYRFIYK